MRRIDHPGPPSPERTRSVACRAAPLTLRLEPGRSMLDAARAALAAHRYQGGFIRLRDARMAPLRYVIPAGAPGDGHAAWYSETFAPDGVCEVEEACMFLGRRDGEPFMHCHGIWRTPDGARRMGHLLPAESQLAEPVEAEVHGLSGAIFEAKDDPETQFKLFSPVAAETGTAERPALLATIRPNEDIAAAIEGICARQGIATAEVQGIGSLVGAEFVDGGRVDSYATELLVRDGRVSLEGSEARSNLDIAIVGMDGEIAEGRLARGRNAVCVTFELLILPQA